MFFFFLFVCGNVVVESVFVFSGGVDLWLWDEYFNGVLMLSMDVLRYE